MSLKFQKKENLSFTNFLFTIDPPSQIDAMSAAIAAAVSAAVSAVLSTASISAPQDPIVRVAAGQVPAAGQVAASQVPVAQASVGAADATGQVAAAAAIGGRRSNRRPNRWLQFLQFYRARFGIHFVSRPSELLKEASEQWADLSEEEKEAFRYHAEQ